MKRRKNHRDIEEAREIEELLNAADKREPNFMGFVIIVAVGALMFFMTVVGIVTK